MDRKIEIYTEKDEGYGPCDEGGYRSGDDGM